MEERVYTQPDLKDPSNLNLHAICDTFEYCGFRLSSEVSYDFTNNKQTAHIKMSFWFNELQSSAIIPDPEHWTLFPLGQAGGIRLASSLPPATQSVLRERLQLKLQVAKSKTKQTLAYPMCRPSVHVLLLWLTCSLTCAPIWARLPARLEPHSKGREARAGFGVRKKRSAGCQVKPESGSVMLTPYSSNPVY